MAADPYPRKFFPFCCCYDTVGKDPRNQSATVPDTGRYKIGDRVEARKSGNAMGRFYPGVVTGKFIAGVSQHSASDECDCYSDCAVAIRAMSCAVCCQTASSRWWRYDIEYDKLDENGNKLFDKGLKQSFVLPGTTPAPAAPAAPEQESLTRT